MKLNMNSSNNVIYKPLDRSVLSSLLDFGGSYLILVSHHNWPDPWFHAVRPITNDLDMVSSFTF